MDDLDFTENYCALLKRGGFSCFDDFDVLLIVLQESFQANIRTYYHQVSAVSSRERLGAKLVMQLLPLEADDILRYL